MKMMDLIKHNNKKKNIADPPKKYPVQSESYQLYEAIGQGATATVYRAKCLPFNEIVAIKVIDCPHLKDEDIVSHETQLMSMINHPNVVNSHCSFARGDDIWIVMPYMDVGSCEHLLKYGFPKGFKGDSVIASVLYESLKGLAYLHDLGHVHRDIKAGNILIDGKTGSVKIGDLGVSACLYDSVERYGTTHTFIGTPCWMAPEVIKAIVPEEKGYGLKADIWSFGILALELAYGHAPFWKCPLLKVLDMIVSDEPPGFKDYEKQGDVRKFPGSFKKLIAECLVKDPGKRPHAKDLLNHSFFKHHANKSNSGSVVHKILKELKDTSLIDRMKWLKEKERDLIERKGKSNAEKEEISQTEYKRGISNWDFDLDAFKKKGFFEDGHLDTIQSCSISSTSPLDTEDMVAHLAANEQSCDVTKVDQEVASDSACLPVSIATEDDGCRKQEGRVVERRGRFLVTTGDVVYPSGMLQNKSFSVH